jgi:hypothetical protein
MSDAPQQDDELENILDRLFAVYLPTKEVAGGIVPDVPSRSEVERAIATQFAKAYEAGREAQRLDMQPRMQACRDEVKKLAIALQEDDEAHEHDQALAVIAARIDEVRKMNPYGALTYCNAREKYLLAQKAKLEGEKPNAN